MQVRPLQDEADVRALTIAHGRAWRAAYDDVLPDAIIERVALGTPDDKRIGSEYERLSGYGDDRVFVVEDEEGSVRGYAVFRWEATGFDQPAGGNLAELKELYVDPDWWGEGYGTALLEAGVNRLPHGVDELVVEVLAGNDVGISFYEARGFERDGESSFSVDGESFPTRVYRLPLGNRSETKR